MRKLNILVHLRPQLAFDREVLAGVGTCAHSVGNVVLHYHSWFHEKDVNFIAATDEVKADGVIISTSRQDEVQNVLASRLPAVNIANFLEAHSQVPVVGNDDAAVGRIVADHYLERGFKSFAYYADLNVRYFRPRQEAFCAAIREAGFECAVGPPRPPEGSKPHDAFGHFAEWLASLPKPLGIMCPHDAYALQAIHSIQAQTSAPDRSEVMRIPEEVSVIGVDNDLPICLMVSPQISSVATAAQKIGFSALDLLLTLIDGKPAPAAPILLPPNGIVERGSSSELAISDTDVSMAVGYIRTHLRQRLTIGDLVKAVAVSRRTLERKFLETLGRTPSEEIRRVRVAHARRLLIETDLSLPEVARRSGLIWHQRLSNLLKTEYGVTPARLREQFRRPD